MRRALEIDEKSFGPDHPNVAIELNNLARLLHDTNRLDEAEPLMHDALEIEKIYGRIIPMWRPNSTISPYCCKQPTASAEATPRRAKKSFGADIVPAAMRRERRRASNSRHGRDHPGDPRLNTTDASEDAAKRRGGDARR